MDFQQKAYQVIGIISIILLIIALGFIITQSIINIIYSFKYNDTIIAERLVYEQFSHEVYSNINSYPITEINIIGKDSNCPEYFEEINIPIKIEEFYDCGNNDNIDEFCQNKITPESLCCHKSCCFEIIENKRENKYCLQKRELSGNDIRKDNDPRENVCAKFSKYLGKFYIFNEKKICAKKSNKGYEELLRNSEKDGCGNLDSKGHCDYTTEHLKYTIDEINYYTSLISVKNIFSTTEPNDFEMESKLRISMMLNRKNYNENKIRKEIQKISEISSKNIYNAFNDEKCTDNCSSTKYHIIDYYYYLKDKLSDEYIFKNFKNDYYYSNKKIYWYSRNYIGFQNSTELNKFKTFFDVNDHKNNSLYKISKTLFPNFESIFIGIFVIVLSILLIIHLIKKNNVNDDYKLDYLILLVIFILFLLYFLMYLIGYLVKFKEIDIDMEDFYRNILKKYNYRRRQLYLMIAVIILIVDIFLELLKLNIKYSFNNPETNVGINYINVKIKINESQCQAEHKIRLYHTQKFSDYTTKINKIFSKCRNCRDFDINSYKINGNEIDENKIIQDIIKDGNEIICEE